MRHQLADDPDDAGGWTPPHQEGLHTAPSNLVNEVTTDGVDYLIREGDEGDSLFILLSGAASVRRKNGHDVAHKLATLSIGDVAGEMSLLTGETRAASIIATTRLETLEISRDALALILKNRPTIAEELSRLFIIRGTYPRHSWGV